MSSSFLAFSTFFQQPAMQQPTKAQSLTGINLGGQPLMHRTEGKYIQTSIIRGSRSSAVLRPKLSTPNLYEIQLDLYYPRTSFICGFWDQVPRKIEIWFYEKDVWSDVDNDLQTPGDELNPQHTITVSISSKSVVLFLIWVNATN